MYRRLKKAFNEVNIQFKIVESKENSLAEVTKYLEYTKKYFQVITDIYKENMSSSINTYVKTKDHVEETTKLITSETIRIIENLNQSNAEIDIRRIWYKKFSDCKPASHPYFLSEAAHKKMYFSSLIISGEVLEYKNLPQLSEELLKYDEKLLVNLLLQLIHNKQFKKLKTLQEPIIAHQSLIRKYGFLIFSLLSNYLYQNNLDDEKISSSQVKRLYKLTFKYKPNLGSEIEKEEYQRACCNYGIILAEGTQNDYPDFKLAGYFLAKANTKTANIYLAHLLARGLGVTQDTGKALALLTSSEMSEIYPAYAQLHVDISCYRKESKFILNHILKFLKKNPEDQLKKKFPIIIDSIYSTIMVVCLESYQQSNGISEKQFYKNIALE